MASIFSYKWIPNDTDKNVRIEIYQSGVLTTQQMYPTDLSLASADVTAYCEALIARMEVDYADSLVLIAAQAAADAAYDAAASALNADKPASPVTIADADVTAALLADIKVKILAAATANNVNPYSLVDTYQTQYTDAGITIDLYDIVFEGYGAAIKIALYNDADADGVQDGGETASGLPSGAYLRVYSDLTDASVYTDFQEANGMLLGYGFETGSHIYVVFLPAGYNLTGGSLTKQVTLTDDTIKDEGTRGVATIGSPPPLLGGFTAHIFMDTDGDGTQDGGEANGSTVPVVITMVGTLGGRAYVADANGNFNVANDLMPEVDGYTFDITRPGTHNVTNAGALTVPYTGRTVTQNAQTAFGDWGIVAD